MGHVACSRTVVAQAVRGRVDVQRETGEFNAKAQRRKGAKNPEIEFILFLQSVDHTIT
ncbi:hypothetical protein WME79_15280 [Sorangium sp. So ce726]|uniref:hypothetical protein n=1 Tax=Sorangium sp. So ce726 TaxID=3133319 RepID=UPI003F614464